MTSVRTEKAEVTRRLSSDTWRDCTVTGPSGAEPRFYTKPMRDIYLTPPGPRCSVFRHERGLSADLAGTGTTLQQGGGLRGVPGLSALAPGMGMSAMRRTRGVVGATCPLSLWPVPIRAVDHRGHDLSGQSSAADDLVPRQ